MDLPARLASHVPFLGTLESFQALFRFDDGHGFLSGDGRRPSRRLETISRALLRYQRPGAGFIGRGARLSGRGPLGGGD